MRRRILGAGLSLFGLSLGAPFASETGAAPLRLGVHPYASTLTLINTFRPLQRHLAESLGQPVEFYTAASFDAFVDTLMSGGYDVVISPPHFAVMAMEKQYLPLLHFRTSLEPVLAVLNDSPYQRPQDFRGKRIAMADRTAFIRLVVVKWLADNGLQAGKDYQIVERPSHGASVGAVKAGEADAGLTTTTALRQLPADLQQQVRPITTALRFPHLFTMANARLGDAQVGRLRAALLAFPTTDEGRLFMEKTAFGGYEPISEEKIKVLRPYVDLYRQLAGSR
jgi:phosphonate transport system substrate-binding protein